MRAVTISFLPLIGASHTDNFGDGGCHADWQIMTTSKVPDLPWLPAMSCRPIDEREIAD
jgi:hypothetical protein